MCSEDHPKFVGVLNFRKIYHYHLLRKEHRRINSFAKMSVREHCLRVLENRPVKKFVDPPRKVAFGDRDTAT